jgi:hypothetical protein
MDLAYSQTSTQAHTHTHTHTATSGHCHVYLDIERLRSLLASGELLQSMMGSWRNSCRKLYCCNAKLALMIIEIQLINYNAIFQYSSSQVHSKHYSTLTDCMAPFPRSCLSVAIAASGFRVLSNMSNKQAATVHAHIYLSR